MSAITDVGDEMERQELTWGQQDHPDIFWLAILTEEVGEAAKAILEHGDVRRELVQVAAVALSWIQCIDRYEELEIYDDHD